MADIPEDVRNTAYAMAMRLVDRDRDSGENADVIAEAILAERERCAKIAEAECSFHNDSRDVDEMMQMAARDDAARSIADAIRAPGIPS